MKDKDKTFEDHLKDIQDEYRIGDHRVVWEQTSNRTKIGNWRGICGEPVIGSYYFRVQPSRDEIAFLQITKIKRNGEPEGSHVRETTGPLPIKGKVFSPSFKKIGLDYQIYCQNWYLEFLAKYRAGEI